MENTNTYKAISLGIIIVFGGCLIWLLMSRYDLARTTTALDQSKLKFETLLSEKLLVEKSLGKATKSLDTMKKEKAVLHAELQQANDLIAQERIDNRKISTALRAAKSKIQESDSKIQSLTADLKSSSMVLDRATSNLKAKSDSILRLSQQVFVIQSRLDDAITRSIDQTLILAEKRNDRLTSKARRTEELVAQVELPSTLNSLTFTVQRPDGSVVSTEGTLSARQLANEGSLTASVSSMTMPVFETKTMEIAYKPKEKLERGLYVFKIFNGSDYVGSMNIRLR